MSLLIDERKESLQKLLDAKREMRKMHDPELMKHQPDPPKRYVVNVL
ncbi:hypothetical protein [Shewanella putrefaciens]|nr:hypothetical protein [Shewanella putrefaciens]